jgi:3'-5' exoribonuclease
MKSHFVVDLAEGQTVASLFLVREKEIRTSIRTGSSWLQLELADRTGIIPAKMWDNFTALAATFERDDVIEIRGRVKFYNGQKELTLEQIVPVVRHDYELSDFLPHTKYDVERLYADLCAAVTGVRNPWLRRLLSSVVDDPAIVPKLKRAPAAMTMHHAYLGGLLEHIVSMIGLAHAVAVHYPDLDPDLLVAGVVLHDIGKIDELHYTRGISYSTEGRLLGHIMIGVSLVHEKIRAIPGFPAPLGVLVEHLILSHHGSHEFGSPSLPLTCEALALHFIDDMDGKMAGVRASLELPTGERAPDLWTDRNPSLRRAMLRADRFLGSDGTLASIGPQHAVGKGADERAIGNSGEVPPKTPSTVPKG